MLKDLSADEIRSTFVKQLVGLDASQWLDGLLTELKASNEELEKSYESGGRQLQEIQQIDATYFAERFSRLNKLVDELQKQTDKRSLQLGQFVFRLELFFDTYLGPKERLALTQWRREFSAVAEDYRRIENDGTKLIAEMRAMVENLKGTQ